MARTGSTTSAAPAGTSTPRITMFAENIGVSRFQEYACQAKWKSSFRTTMRGILAGFTRVVILSPGGGLQRRARERSQQYPPSAGGAPRVALDP